MAELAFWIGAMLFIYGGVDVLRKGLKISKSKTISGSAATVVGIVLIIVGIAIGLGASLYLRFGS